MRGIFEEFAEGKPVTQQFRRIAYDDAIRTYGSDKPDLRNPIEMQAVTEHFAGSGFKVFANMIANDPKVEVWAIPAKTGGSRAFCDRMNSGRRAKVSRVSATSSGARKAISLKALARLPRTLVKNAQKRSATSWASATAMPASS